MVREAGTPIESLSHVSAMGLSEFMEVQDSVLQKLIASLCIFNPIDCFVDAVNIRKLITLGIMDGSTTFAEEEDLFE